MINLTKQDILDSILAQDEFETFKHYLLTFSIFHVEYFELIKDIDIYVDTRKENIFVYFSLSIGDLMYTFSRDRALVVLPILTASLVSNIDTNHTFIDNPMHEIPLDADAIEGLAQYRHYGKVLKRQLQKIGFQQLFSVL